MTTTDGGTTNGTDATNPVDATDATVVPLRDVTAALDHSAPPADTGTRDSSDVTRTGDSGASPAVGADGGTVDRLRFAVFGDVRPSLPDVAPYPTMVFTQVMDGVEAENVQFAVGTGDYMFFELLLDVPRHAQLMPNIARRAETHSSATTSFHAMGNHECNSITTVNCPNQNESTNVTTYKSVLIPGRPNAYPSIGTS